MSDEVRVGGLHAVAAALSQGRVLELWADRSRKDKRLAAVLAEAQAKGLAVHRVERGDLEDLLPNVRHQGVVARCRTRAVHAEADLPDLVQGIAGPPFVLVLDGVQDPHNLGACLRSADAAGVHLVIAPRDRAASLTPTARKVASGAAETVPFVQVTNLARSLQALKDLGLWVVGAAGEGETELYAADLKGPLALVMGAEGKGLRRLTRERCDLLVHIPLSGTVESLNVSVATGVCLFEAVRQRSGGGDGR